MIISGWTLSSQDTWSAWNVSHLKHGSALNSSMTFAKGHTQISTRCFLFCCHFLFFLHSYTHRSTMQRCQHNNDAVCRSRGMAVYRFRGIVVMQVQRRGCLQVQRRGSLQVQRHGSLQVQKHGSLQVQRRGCPQRCHRLWRISERITVCMKVQWSLSKLKSDTMSLRVSVAVDTTITTGWTDFEEIHYLPFNTLGLLKRTKAKASTFYQVRIIKSCIFGHAYQRSLLDRKHWNQWLLTVLDNWVNF